MDVSSYCATCGWLCSIVITDHAVYVFVVCADHLCHSNVFIFLGLIHSFLHGKCLLRMQLFRLLNAFDAVPVFVWTRSTSACNRQTYDMLLVAKLHIYIADARQKRVHIFCLALYIVLRPRQNWKFTRIVLASC